MDEETSARPRQKGTDMSALMEHQAAEMSETPRASFLRLPLELRQQIYDHLIEPTKDQKRRVWIDTMLKSSIRRVQDVPHLALNQTCRQIHEEYFDRFYALTQFVITVLPANTFVSSSSIEAGKPRLPETEFQLSKIRDVVLVILLEELDGGSYFDMQALMRSLPSLSRLAVAFTFQERMYIHKGNAERWKESALLQGIVCRIVQSVPKHVLLQWTAGTEQNDQLRGRKWSMGPCAYISSKILGEVAGAFESLRGMLAS